MNFPDDFELDYPTHLAKDVPDLNDFLTGIETLEAQRHSHGVNAFNSAFQGIANASYDITLPPGDSHASNMMQDWTSIVPASDIHNIPDPVTIFSDPEGFEITFQPENGLSNSRINGDSESSKSDASVMPSEAKVKVVESPMITELDMKDDDIDVGGDLDSDPFLGLSEFKPASNPASITVPSPNGIGAKTIASNPSGNNVAFSPFTSQQLHPVPSIDIEKLTNISPNVPINFPANWANLNLLNNRMNDSFPSYQHLARTLLSQQNLGAVTQTGDNTVRPKCVVEVVVPPPRSDLPIDNDPAKESEEGAESKEETMDELMHLLTPLVNKDWGLGHVDHIPKFVKFMRSEEQSTHRSLLLTVLVNTTDRSILKSFANSKGPTILRMWIVQAQKENNPLLTKLLEVLKKVPMDIDTLKETLLGRVIKTLKNSELEDVKKLATELMDRWTKLIQQEASAPAPKKRPSEKAENDASKSDTDLAKEDTRKKARPEKPTNPDVTSSSKPTAIGAGNKAKQLGASKTSGPARQEKSTASNAMAVANVDFFNELSASALPKISKVRPSTTSKLGVQSSKPKNTSFSPLDALLPKIMSKDGNNLKRGNSESRDGERKSKASRTGVESIMTDIHPSTRPDTESVLKPGTKKKRVSFAPDHALVQIREFKTEVEEPSMSVTKDWETPKPILFEFDVPQRGADSKEIGVQQAREAGVLSALYFSESQIPDTPNEPTDDVREDPTYQVKVIPLYDVGSETFQLSQLLSQVQATAPILAPLPTTTAINPDSHAPPTSSWDHEPETGNYSWQKESTQSPHWPAQPDRDHWDRQDAQYNPDSPGSGQASNYPSNDPSKPAYHDDEQGYDPYQEYPQDSREEYDPSYQSYGNDYDGYNEFDNGEAWDYNGGYEEGDRPWRFGAGRNQFGRGRGRGARGRGGPNRNGNRWGPGRDGPAPNPRVGTAPCKFFAEGSCRFGDKCRFSHDFGRGR
ncbi:hypothetical protein K493DRAFT_317653 [Basidiobolus meristosporus CBS 931.73]|uniref:Serine/threonine-protein phosphatase 1 regulatory subunit 10 n=1 Tax=Basidiobolus meristosporus CBS 931.73 TaxID=1314790 RepID=A0A1Y1XYZ9_9FUNG|nr:hypothetical protein K493DRAFT_317653 [Basidiobolus meristosporus CBS 931.73]|eukprot:ORX90885.1 hypothetical protein K493DRAFT_317653 [Basidiobolus meristosporus CBS 931.73]